MKILHTGDWHMNDRLGRIERAEDIVRSLERIAGYLEEQAVDVMIVAGDLFCDRSSKEDMRTAVEDVRRIFLPFLARGGTIVAISGNHDSDVYFEMLRHTLELAPGQAQVSGTDPTGRLYVFARPNLLRLADPAGTVVQFALMPYPSIAFLRDTPFENAADQNQTIQGRYARYLKERLLPRLDQRLPTVLVSHIYIHGVTLRSGFRLSEEQDIVFQPGDIPTGFAYVALGHIHQPQEALANAPWVRYCGSIERLDAGEKDDTKSVALVEVGPAGRVKDPILLPLEATPIHQIVITDPDTQMDALDTSYPDAEYALVHYTLHYQPGKHSLDTLRRRIHARFLRWYACDLRPLRPDGTPPPPPPDLSNVRTTVTDYLEGALKSDPRRAELLAMAAELLQEEGVTA